jgi:small subunit ribosomal protein S4
MSRYRGPKLCIIRRLGLLPGLTSKISKKTVLSGQSSGNSTKKSSPYLVRLKEKQKLRYHYGITERQLLNYIVKARRKKGSVGFILLTFLEMRLDNIVFRLGLAPTIAAARQLVTHGHILCNNSIVTIPSYLCRPKEIISVKRSLDSQKLVKENLSKLSDSVVPQHLSLDKENLQGKIISFVNRRSVSLLINELLIIEYYSRKL